MSSCSKVATIDLSASQARVDSARRLAVGQLRHVEATGGRADDHALDMLFLLEESVLVFTETHAMLAQLAREDDRRSRRAGLPAASARASVGRHAGVAALVFLVALIASACALELLDPAPMDAVAAWTGWP